MYVEYITLLDCIIDIRCKLNYRCKYDANTLERGLYDVL